ncbi:MAG: ATP-binding cassette, subfamily B, bacterial, partial [Bacteroidetes bacterium]
MKSLAYLNKYFWRYRYRLILGLLFITAYSWFSNVPVSLMGDGIDYVSLAIKAKYSDSRVMQTLLLYGLQIIGITLVYGFFLFLNRQTIIVMSRLIEYDLKNDIYAHYQRLDLSFYKRNNTGDLMNRISEDVNRVRMYLGPAIMYAFTTLISVIVTVFFMLREDPLLTLYVLAPLPVLTISIYYVSNLINKKSMGVQNKLSRLSTLAQEAFSGIRVIKAFAREKKTQETWEKESDNYKSL